MNEGKKLYLVRQHYWTEEGWQDMTAVAVGSLQEAWSCASAMARDLDLMFGGSHHWTVDLMNPNGESYIQLFHGRLE